MFFSGYTIPVVCEKCKVISDELQLFTANEKVETEPNWKCQECRGKKYYFWDHDKKPCPKCAVGTFVIDPDGMVIDVD